MRQSLRNSGKTWTQTENKTLRTLAHQNKPTKFIAGKLKRSTDAIRKHASEKGISLRLKSTTNGRTYKYKVKTRSTSNGRKRH